jgi:hypothetical protein
MALTEHAANVMACEIVKAGLTSGTIKLLGSAGDIDGPEASAERDAEYLDVLLTKLNESIAKLP